MDLTRRIDSPEWMDTRSFPANVVRETLGFLSVTNRFFGGTAVVLKHFERWSRTWKKSETIRVLDVGTGGAEIPLALARWARGRGFELSVTAIDLAPEVAAVARENTREVPEITVGEQNVFDLPAGATAPFDYVIASLLLHHIPPSESVRLLQTFDALAQRGVLISDLFRSKSSYLAVKSLSWLIGNDVVRHDGPLSVRRAFRLEELTELATESGFTYLTAQREPWFRVSLSGEKLFQKRDFSYSSPSSLNGEGREGS